MAKQKQKRPRTYARFRAMSRRGNEKAFETDSKYFLKLVLFVLLATFWIKFETPISWLGTPFNAVPAGLLVGLLLVHKIEKYQSDRKIWYAVLIIVAIICYYTPSGIVI